MGRNELNIDSTAIRFLVRVESNYRRLHLSPCFFFSSALRIARPRPAPSGPSPDVDRPRRYITSSRALVALRYASLPPDSSSSSSHPIDRYDRLPRAH